MKAKLIDTLHGREFVLNQGETTIGREKDNDIILDDDVVSRYHARILVKANRFYLHDLDSSNGTKLNDGFIKESAIKNNDEIQFGNVRFRFSAETGKPRKIKLGILTLILFFVILIIWILAFPKTKILKGNIPESDARVKEAEHLYREGMKDYLSRDEDSRNIQIALRKWSKALALDPDFKLAKDSIETAQKELEDIALKHYLAGERLSEHSHFNQSINQWRKAQKIINDKDHPLYKKAEDKILEVKKKK